MGLTLDKLLVILVIAVFVVGPERLPLYAKKLGDLVRTVKKMADGAKDRLRDEMGPEFDDVDWKQLDPRQYDPRRIIRDALLDDVQDEVRGGAGAVGTAAGATGIAAAASSAQRPDTGEFHFDDEAT